MGDRYWISGAQLGMLKSQNLYDVNIAGLLDGIEEEQFIGRIEEEDKNKMEVEIIEREITRGNKIYG